MSKLNIADDSANRKKQPLRLFDCGCFCFASFICFEIVFFVQIWECRNCGHTVTGTKAPEVCPTCNHPQSYFEVHAENY